jgi:hypothetical protein
MSFGKTAPIESSVRIENFMSGALGVTTDCSVKRGPTYLTVSELVKECRKSSTCLDGEGACTALQGTMNGIMESTFRINEDSPTTYWSVRALYLQNATEDEEDEFFKIEKGNCTGVKSGDIQSISALPGVIRLETQVCSS